MLNLLKLYLYVSDQSGSDEDEDNINGIKFFIVISHLAATSLYVFIININDNMILITVHCKNITTRNVPANLNLFYLSFAEFI